ncbi:MAG: beta-CASP ribonuclease aCPSF1 [Candidatus Odinarchaeia archaeon]
MAKEILNEIRETILNFLPTKAQVTKVEFEGPEIAIYSKNPRVLMDNGESIKELVKQIRKRIVVRSDPSVRMDPKEAEKKIKEIVPPEAEITKIYFDDNVGEVVIEAKKPGLVIGRNGVTLNEITKTILWRPSVVRSPPIDSKMIMQIRTILQNESIARKRILKAIGERIHRPLIFKDDWVRIFSLGGFREVGRTCMLIQTAESNVLIDCGVNVGSTTQAFPRLDLPEFDIDKLDAVIVTHAHLDHSGFVPFLFKYGYDGPVYCTTATRNLMTLLQLDYLDVANREGKLLPYSPKDVKKMILHTIPLEFGEVTDISPDIRLTLHNAGHILGSSIVHLHIGDGLYNLAYTGDFKFAKSRLLEMANYVFPRLETLIIESTYGGVNDTMPPRRESERKLVEIISETVSKGGKVLIPVLAVGRAQEIILVLEEYIRRGVIKEIPIFIDGMISEATAIHTTHPEYLAKDLREKIFHYGHNPFTADYFVQVDNMSERTDIVEGDPCVIMATSGMLSIDYEEPVYVKVDNAVKLIKIGEFVDSLITKNRDKAVIIDHIEVLNTEDEDLEAVALDKNLEFTFSKITKVIRHKISEDLYEITTVDGRKVKCTGSHSVFAVREGNIVSVPVSQLTENDYLIAPKMLPTHVLDNLNVIEYLLKEGSQKQLNSVMIEKLLIDNKLVDKINIASLMNICDWRVSNETIISHADERVPALIPLGSEFSKLLAYLTVKGKLEANGQHTVISVNLREETQVKELVECAQNVLKTNIEIVKQKEGFTVNIYGGSLLKYLMKLFGLHFNGCKGIPTIVFNIPIESRKLFIRKILSMLEEQDNTLRLGEEFKSHIVYLVSTIYDNDSTFYDQIMSKLDLVSCPKIPTNHLGLKDLVNSVSNIDLNCNSLVNLEEIEVKDAQQIVDKLYSTNSLNDAQKSKINFIKRVIESHMKLVKIKTIKKVEPSEKYVYDLSVEDNESFIGGRAPLLLHNTGGPSVEYFKLMAPDPKNALIFVSYQVEGSLGRRIQKGWREIPMYNGEGGKTEIVRVNLKVHAIEGFSGHSDRRQLLNYIAKVIPKPEKVLTCHGDNSKCANLASAIHALYKIETKAPQNMEATRIK